MPGVLSLLQHVSCMFTSRALVLHVRRIIACWFVLYEIRFRHMLASQLQQYAWYVRKLYVRIAHIAVPGTPVACDNGDIAHTGYLSLFY